MICEPVHDYAITAASRLPCLEPSASDTVSSVLPSDSFDIQRPIGHGSGLPCLAGASGLGSPPVTAGPSSSTPCSHLNRSGASLFKFNGHREQS